MTKLLAIPGGFEEGITAVASDVGNAEALVDRFGDELRFVDEWGLWAVWDGRRWVIDKSGARAFRFAVLTVRQLLKDAIDAKSAPDKQWATQSQKAPRLAAMLEVARSDPKVRISFKDLDADPMRQTPWVARRDYFGDFDIAPVSCPPGTTRAQGQGCAVTPVR